MPESSSSKPVSTDTLLPNGRWWRLTDAFNGPTTNEKPPGSSNPPGIGPTPGGSGKPLQPLLRAKDGLLLLFLLLLGACSRLPPVPAPPVVVRLEPPTALLLPTPMPVCDPITNLDLAQCILDLTLALRQANGDKSAVRSWVVSGVASDSAGRTD